MKLLRFLKLEMELVITLIYYIFDISITDFAVLLTFIIISVQQYTSYSFLLFLRVQHNDLQPDYLIIVNILN